MDPVIESHIAQHRHPRHPRPFPPPFCVPPCSSFRHSRQAVVVPFAKQERKQVALAPVDCDEDALFVLWRQVDMTTSSSWTLCWFGRSKKNAFARGGGGEAAGITYILPRGMEREKKKMRFRGVEAGRMGTSHASRRRLV